jgi:hypothetical protein
MPGAVFSTLIVVFGWGYFIWTGSISSVRDNFWPMAIGPDPSLHFQGYLNTTLTVVMLVSVVVILSNGIWKWVRVLSRRQLVGSLAR